MWCSVAGEVADDVSEDNIAFTFRVKHSKKNLVYIQETKIFSNSDVETSHLASLKHSS